jgi:hypothetical protein
VTTYYLTPDPDDPTPKTPLAPEEKRWVWLTEHNTGKRVSRLWLDGYEIYNLIKQLEQGWMYEGLKD